MERGELGHGLPQVSESRYGVGWDRNQQALINRLVALPRIMKLRSTSLFKLEIR